MFSTALPYLEQALAVEPDDRETLRSLRDIYARVGMDDKMLEVSAKLKASINRHQELGWGVSDSPFFSPHYFT